MKIKKFEEINESFLKTGSKIISKDNIKDIQNHVFRRWANSGFKIFYVNLEGDIIEYEEMDDAYMLRSKLALYLSKEFPFLIVIKKLTEEYRELINNVINYKKSQEEKIHTMSEMVYKKLLEDSSKEDKNGIF